MQLHQLLSDSQPQVVQGSDAIEVTSLAYDSRQVVPGTLFFCIENNRRDGHDFIADARARGAVGIVVGHSVSVPSPTTVVHVAHPARALALAASHFDGDPSHQMRMIGVTGTNGKTTTAWLIEALLERAGLRPGLLGTVAVKIGGQVETPHNTTPLSLELQQILGRMQAAGHLSVSMEVSSHGLALDRVYGIPYDVAVFTNLTQDHLDFHGSMENYFLAKRLLFEQLGQNNPKHFPVRAVLNADDPYTPRLQAVLQVPHLTYGVTQRADVKAEDVVTEFSGTTYRVVTATGSFPIRMRLAGTFNVYNSLAAIAAALSQDIPVPVIQDAMQKIPPVRGRFELVDESQDFSVVVDYAHTPDGLENILKAARPMTRGNLIAVFGCGGDRDRTKRPIMGGIAARWADRLIITSDNPRTEDPDRIVADIEVGCKDLATGYELIVDRQTAIEKALGSASAGDTVVIAGKGHETYQIFRDRTIHFDDVEVARNFLRGTVLQRGGLLMLHLLLALGTAAGVVVAIMPWFIQTVRRLAWGQQIRQDGPKDHQVKQGTPTMGGLIIVVGILAGCVWAWSFGHHWDILMLVWCVLGNCAIGFFDDYAKIRKQRNLGLSSRQKLAAQLLVGAVLGVYLVAFHPSGMTVVLPLAGAVHSGVLAFLLTVAVMLSTTNAVNLTDGLDGLAGGTTVAAAVAYTAIAWLGGRLDLAVCSAALAGACLGFLRYNRYPAKVFMGDTGSLALGGALTAMAVLTRTEWLLFAVGGIFVAEAASVILQVGYFKLTHGKRIFRMSPLHHHFCEGGWHETRVTATFWKLAAVMGAGGVALWCCMRPLWPPL